jgi:hypothetical protein
MVEFLVHSYFHKLNVPERLEALWTMEVSKSVQKSLDGRWCRLLVVVLVVAAAAAAAVATT